MSSRRRDASSELWEGHTLAFDTIPIGVGHLYTLYAYETYIIYNNGFFFVVDSLRHKPVVQRSRVGLMTTTRSLPAVSLGIPRYIAVERRVICSARGDAYIYMREEMDL